MPLIRAFAPEAEIPHAPCEVAKAGNGPTFDLACLRPDPQGQRMIRYPFWSGGRSGAVIFARALR